MWKKKKEKLGTKKQQHYAPRNENRAPKKTFSSLVRKSQTYISTDSQRKQPRTNAPKNEVIKKITDTLASNHAD